MCCKAHPHKTLPMAKSLALALTGLFPSRGIWQVYFLNTGLRAGEGVIKGACYSFRGPEFIFPAPKYQVAHKHS